MKAPSKESQEQLAIWLREASDGKQPWLAKLLRASEDPDAWRWLSREQAASCLDCSKMNVDKLTAEGKIARATISKYRGKIDVVSLCAHIQRRSQPQPLASESTRYRKLKADLAQMEVDLKTGKLVKREDVVRIFGQAGALLKTTLIEQVARLPEVLAGRDVRAIAVTLDREFRTMLTDFSEQIMGLDALQNGTAR